METTHTCTLIFILSVGEAAKIHTLTHIHTHTKAHVHGHKDTHILGRRNTICNARH